jgi:uncharacterized protein with HEPN domain
MRRPEVLKFLYDIKVACELLAQFTAGRQLGDYLADPMLRSAVERQFEIIGEALNGALALDASLALVVTNAPRIIAFRNRLIHGYATVSNEVVWGVVAGGLPILHREVEALLAESAPSQRL